MRWDELDPHRIGQTNEGDPTFSMPLETDEDGMVGRESPDESEKKPVVESEKWDRA